MRRTPTRSRGGDSWYPAQEDSAWHEGDEWDEAPATWYSTPGVPSAAPEFLSGDEQSAGDRPRPSRTPSRGPTPTVAPSRQSSAPRRQLAQSRAGPPQSPPRRDNSDRSRSQRNASTPIADQVSGLLRFSESQAAPPKSQQILRPKSLGARPSPPAPSEGPIDASLANRAKKSQDHPSTKPEPAQSSGWLASQWLKPSQWKGQLSGQRGRGSKGSAARSGARGPSQSSSSRPAPEGGENQEEFGLTSHVVLQVARSHLEPSRNTTIWCRHSKIGGETSLEEHISGVPYCPFCKC